MRLAVVADGVPRLCALDGGLLRPVCDYGDLAELVAATPGLALAKAVGADSLGGPIATWHEAQARLLAPVRPAEVWAAGMTYERSRDARTNETGPLDI